MKKTMMVMVCLLGVSLLYGEEAVRPYLGLRLQPLPEALASNLQLKADQALLVGDVVVNSPADKAGLDKDNVIVSFNGKEFNGYQDFLGKIQQEGVGKEITLAVLQNGVRKTVTMTLAAAPDKAEAITWKYAGKVEAQQPEYKIMRKLPDQDQWQSVPPSGKDPFDSLDDYFRRFFQQIPTQPNAPNGVSPTAPYVIPSPGVPFNPVPDKQDDLQINMRDQLRDLNDRLDKLEKQQEEILNRLKDLQAGEREGSVNR